MFSNQAYFLKLGLKYSNFSNVFSVSLICLCQINFERCRSSRPELFYFKNFIKFPGQHLCQSLVFCNFIKKRPRSRCFPVNFTKFLIKHFYRTPLTPMKSVTKFVFEYISMEHVNLRQCIRFYQKTQPAIAYSKLTIETLES